MPPLRQRKDDIPILVEYFAARYAARLGKRFRHRPRDDGPRSAYAWPGNVRELQNVIERAVVLAEDGVLRLEEGDLHHHAPPRVAEERKVGPELTPAP